MGDVSKEEDGEVGWGNKGRGDENSQVHGALGGQFCTFFAWPSSQSSYSTDKS